MPCDASFSIAYSMFYFSGPMGIQCSFMYRQKKNIINNLGKSLILFFILSKLIMYGYLLFYLKHRMKKMFDVHSAGGQTLSNQSAGGFKALYHHSDLPSHVYPVYLYADFPCIGLLKKRFM